MSKWFDFDLSLESELNLQQGIRAIEGADDLEKLKDVSKTLLHNWFLTKHLLRQHIARVLELERQVSFDRGFAHPQNPDSAVADLHRPPEVPPT